MARMCGCGLEIISIMDEWGCLECGGLCCPACGYTPEGTAYCPDCAQSRFDVYTRPVIIAHSKRVMAWWETAAAQPARSRATAERLP